MIRVALAGIVLALTGCGGGCNPPPTPSSETCDGQAHGTVTGVDLGRFDGTTYTQYQDDDVIPLIYGGQGLPMLVVNLRARGSELGTCLPQTTRVRADGVEVGSQAEALILDQVLPDTWISGDQLLIDYPVTSGDSIEIESEAGGVTTSVFVWIDYMPIGPDAAP